MHLLRAEEVSQLDLEEARQAALNYSKLAGQMEHQISTLTKGYQELLRRMEQDQQQAMFAKEVMSGLQKQLFAPKSEKRPIHVIGPGEEKPPKKKRSHHGRTPQPELPTLVVPHELPEADRKCDACGGELREWIGQFEASERIQVIPAKFIIENHQRKKYRCECGGCVKTAPGPAQLKAGSRYSPEFGVEVGVNKYEHHLPLERQVRMMAQAGLAVESQTLFSQTDTIAWYLKEHLYERIGEKVRSAPVALADETPWKNLAKKMPDAKKRAFYLWGIRAESAVYFTIADSRSSEVAESLVKSFSGVLMCDGFRGYNPLKSSEIELAHCWSHARRKFIAAEQAYPAESAEMVALIRELYRIEKELKAAGANPDEIRSRRQAESLPITENIYQKLWDFKMHLPQGSLGKAVDYTLKLWRGLIVFLDNPGVPLDNNGMERAIRAPVTGRKNHHGSKNLKTAQVASIWYTVIETCKANGVDPKAYVNGALLEILRGEKPAMPWELAEKGVSETVVLETVALLDQKPAQIGPIPVA